MIKKVYGSVNNDTKTLYIVNHKVANNTIVSILKKYGYTSRFGVDPTDLNYIFTVVRNPYDRLLSRYSHLCRRISELNNGEKIKNFPQDKNILNYFNGFPIEIKNFKFKDFVKFTQTVFDPHWEPQVDKFERQVDSLVNINYIGRFENLQEDFDIICDKIGIPRQKLPHKNKSKHKHYTEYYDDETRQIVAEKYAKDIEYFGYEFGE
jgi:hypothetical protein